MTFPLAYLANFDAIGGAPRLAALATAVIAGIAFGFVLERAGFGRAQKLMGQFHGTDMTVLKVMFTAIATAMLGAVVLAGLGAFDLAAVQLNYPTFLWPMIAGGLLLGAGFVTSGYCPGTCFVATASGKVDGLAAIGGVVLGSLLSAEVEPRLGGFLTAGRLGTFTLSQLLGLPASVVAALVVAVALGAFLVAEAIERRLGPEPRPDPGPARKWVFVGLVAFAAAAVATLALPHPAVAAH